MYKHFHISTLRFLLPWYLSILACLMKLVFHCINLNLMTKFKKFSFFFLAIYAFSVNACSCVFYTLILLGCSCSLYWLPKLFSLFQSLIRSRIFCLHRSSIRLQVNFYLKWKLHWIIIRDHQSLSSCDFNWPILPIIFMTAMGRGAHGPRWVVVSQAG